MRERHDLTTHVKVASFFLLFNYDINLHVTVFSNMEIRGTSLNH